MRINKYVALASGLSRRASDKAITEGRVELNGRKASLGDSVKFEDTITLDRRAITPAVKTTIMINKPVGYVCSRKGQGNKTIYDLLPEKYHNLKPVGRLDKDSSGLLLLTNDGELANKLTHPKYQKEKVYLVELNKKLEKEHKKKLLTGVKLSDGMSKFIKVSDCSSNTYEVTLAEGRNRQIRRTFNALSYKVTKLQRLKMGDLSLIKNLKSGEYKSLF